MTHVKRSAAMVAGLLLTFGAIMPLSAQYNSRPAVLAQDTTCTSSARPMGDSTRASQVSITRDSAGLIRSGTRDCLSQKQLAAQADSTCRVMAADSSMHRSSDHAANDVRRMDSLSGKPAKVATVPACPPAEGLGAGVTDSTIGLIKGDSLAPSRP